jgi:hypothetical protein
MATVKFQKANRKLARLARYVTDYRMFPARRNGKPNIYGFSLPAGHSCPFARECLSKANRTTGKLTDGKDTHFRCFMASMEAIYSSLRKSVWDNFDALRQAKTTEAMLDLLEAALPKNADIIRPGVDGDFFNQAYFDAWLELARRHPNILFYAYTKSLNYWVARLGQIPDNFNLTASYGGHLDHLIGQHGLKSSIVVFHPDKADALGLEIDHDETHALFGTASFALLLHGQQPKGSGASEGIKRMKAENIEYAYSD